MLKNCTSLLVLAPYFVPTSLRLCFLLPSSIHMHLCGNGVWEATQTSHTMLRYALLFHGTIPTAVVLFSPCCFGVSCRVSSGECAPRPLHMAHSKARKLQKRWRACCHRFSPQLPVAPFPTPLPTLLSRPTGHKARHSLTPNQAPFVQRFHSRC